MLRVMTYNIRHGRGLNNIVNLKRTLAELATADADVIGLQEVDRFSLRSGYRDQVKVLAQALDMYWVFAPSLTSGWRQYGNAMLSKLPIQHHEVVFLPSRREQRTALNAMLEYDGMAVQIINTHLGLKLSERRNQMTKLLSIVASDDCIVLGDFNMSGSHPFMQPLQQQWQKAKIDEATFYKGAELDHIYVKGSLQVNKAWVQHSSASDHYPVIADLSCDENMVRWQK